MPFYHTMHKGSSSSEWNTHTSPWFTNCLRSVHPRIVWR